MSASIVRFDDFLLVTVQSYMDDQSALELADRLGNAVVRHAARGVIIDISAMEVLDSFMGRTLGTMSAACRLLGAPTVLVGMRPDVAFTLVELGMELPGILTALSVDSATAMLRSSNGK